MGWGDADDDDVFFGAGALVIVFVGCGRIVSLGVGSCVTINTVVAVAAIVVGLEPSCPPSFVIDVVIDEVWAPPARRDDVGLPVPTTVIKVEELAGRWRDVVLVTVTGGVEEEMWLACPPSDTDNEVEL